MKKLLIAALTICLGLGLFACAGNGYDDDYGDDDLIVGFDLEGFLAAAQEDHTPESAFAMTTTGPLTTRYQIPDEAIIAYEMLLSRIAEEWSSGPDDGPRGDAIFTPIFQEMRTDDEPSSVIVVSVEYNVLRQIFDGRLSMAAQDFLIMLMTADEYRNWDNFTPHNIAFARLMRDMNHPAAEYFTHSLG